MNTGSTPGGEREVDGFTLARNINNAFSLFPVFSPNTYHDSHTSSHLNHFSPIINPQLHVTPRLSFSPHFGYGEMTEWTQKTRNQTLEPLMLKPVLHCKVVRIYLLYVPTGPLVSALMAVFGIRAVIMVGTVLSAAGIGLSSQVTEIWHLYITFGLLTGER